MARHLLNLPNELLINIVVATLPPLDKATVRRMRKRSWSSERFLSWKPNLRSWMDCPDLVALRQTSRRLHDVATYVLAQNARNFRCSAMMIDKRRLDTLEGISRDPNLGAIVKTLDISFHYLRSDPICDVYKDASDVDRNIWITPDEMSAYTIARDEQEEMMKSGQAAQSLARALVTFPNLGTVRLTDGSPDLHRTRFDQYRTIIEPWGVQALQESFPNACEGWQRFNHGGEVDTEDRIRNQLTVRTVLAAIAHSGIQQLQELSIRNKNSWNRGMSPTTLSLDPETRELFRSRHVHLEKLSLSQILHKSPGVDGRCNLTCPEEWARILLEFIALFRGLRELEIAGSSWDVVCLEDRKMGFDVEHKFDARPTLEFHHLSRTLQLPELRKLSLGASFVDTKDLLGFFDRHKSLEEVHLLNVLLTPERDTLVAVIEHWLEVIVGAKRSSIVKLMAQAQASEWFSDFICLDVGPGGETEESLQLGAMLDRWSWYGQDRF